MVTREKMSALVVLGGLVACASDAHAGSFMLQEQGVKASGKAFAGAAAAAEDASTIFFNPAGLTELKRSELLIGGYAMFPNAEVSNNGSNTLGVPFEGNNGQGFDPQAFGHIYASTPVTQNLSIGLGVTVPFALANQYDNNFFGRYDSTRASVRVIDIAPTIAYAFSPQVSVGGGIDIQYADANLINSLPTGVPPTVAGDGTFSISGKDWALGYNAGVLFKPMEALRIGATYRSATTHKLEGDATTEIPILSIRTSQAFTADLKLPDTISLGVAYDMTANLTLLTQVNRYGWSRFNEVRLKFADGTEAATTENYRDTWGVSIGAQYKLAPGFVVRGGVMYDQTPTRDEYRSVLVPDTDRFWAAVGASYSFSETLSLDMSYEHMFAKEEPINRTNSFPGGLPTVQTRGNTDTSSDVLGVSLRMQF